VIHDGIGNSAAGCLTYDLRAAPPAGKVNDDQIDPVIAKDVFQYLAYVDRFPVVPGIRPLGELTAN
jgi:hypothetical protein